MTRVALWVNRVFLTLLSIMTGAVKLARMPEEMLIFRVAGFPDWLTILFGVVQLAFGLALLVPALTNRAAYGMAATFVLATGVLFVNGMVAFGVASLLFIASAVAHGRWWPAKG